MRLRQQYIPAFLPTLAVLFCSFALNAEEIGLTISSSLSNSFPTVSEPVELTITLINTGTNIVSAVDVSTQIPEGVAIPSGFAPLASHGVYSPPTGIWSIDSLAVSQTATLILPLVIDQESTASVFVTEATVITPLPVGSDAKGVETAQRLYASQAAASSKLSLVVDSVTTDDLGFLTVDVTVTNDGPDTAENVTVDLSVEATVTFYKSDDTIDLGNLDVGQSVSNTVFTLFDCGQGAYTASYTVTVRSDSPLSPDSVTEASGSISASGTGSCDPLAGSGCFIATAAYGSYLHKDVQTLRDVRDAYLLTNAPGRHFVDLYYQYSPPIADAISRHDWLRFFVRLLLTPIVFALKLPIASLIFAVTLASFCMIRIKKNKRATHATPACDLE